MNALTETKKLKDAIEGVVECYPSGNKISITDPDPSMIDFNDIAGCLAKACRYNGHCRGHYSVAEHSVLVSYLVPEEYALAGLMHDASEAYLSDVPAPYKPFIAGYKEVEKIFDDMIIERLGGNVDLHAWEVKRVDLGILRYEARSLCVSRGDWWAESVHDCYEKFVKPELHRIPAYLRKFNKMLTEDSEPCVIGLGWYDAKQIFLERYNELTR